MRKATDVFGEWAEIGKDEGMEKGHSASVDEMLEFSLNERAQINRKFKFLDLGCGNGWVARRVIKDPLCKEAIGVDGAEQMITIAKSRAETDQYIHSDINFYNPNKKFDLIHSMEVMYYLNDPLSVLKKINKSWLKPDGRLIIGIDLYYENQDSHSWEEKVNTPMLMLKELDWIDLFNQSGLEEIKSWRANQNNGWAGTLVLTGKKRSVELSK